MEPIKTFEVLRQLLNTCERLWVENLAMKTVLEHAPGFSCDVLEDMIVKAELRPRVHQQFERIYAAIREDRDFYTALMAMTPPNGEPN